MTEIINSLKQSAASLENWASDAAGHLRNEALTIADVGKKLPGAVWNEISHDVTTGFSGDKERLAAVATSAAIGAVSLILTRRAPTIMASSAGILKTTAITGGAVEGFNLIKGTASLLSDGWNADTAQKREKLGDSYAKSAATNVTPLIESAIAAGGGAVVADRALALSPRFNVATFESLTERRDFYMRAKFVDRQKLFNGAGGFDLPAEVSANGKVNMNLLTEKLDAPSSNPLTRAIFRNDGNVEVLREVDLSKMRASMPMRGTPWSNSHVAAPEGITYHNHHELVGVQAGIQDAADATGLNIIRSGKYRGYYIGQRESVGAAHVNLTTAIESGKGPALNQLVLHDEGQRAFLLQRDLVLDKTARLWVWNNKPPQYVDYEAASKLLSNIDASSSGAAKAFEGLPKVARELHPDDIQTTTRFVAGSAYERKLKLAGSGQ
ncbi:MAG TPA: hypothetical protein V6C97_15485 [Oculatellaceae cyanobacterium]